MAVFFRSFAERSKRLRNRRELQATTLPPHPFDHFHRRFASRGDLPPIPFGDVVAFRQPGAAYRGDDVE
jgi:hypothetical protein